MPLEQSALFERRLCASGKHRLRRAFGVCQSASADMDFANCVIRAEDARRGGVKADRQKIVGLCAYRRFKHRLHKLWQGFHAVLPHEIACHGIDHGFRPLFVGRKVRFGQVRAAVAIRVVGIINVGHAVTSVTRG
nr:MAG TPA: hypothetical protein [Caudoviricetes sp.]